MLIGVLSVAFVHKKGVKVMFDKITKVISILIFIAVFILGITFMSLKIMDNHTANVVLNMVQSNTTSEYVNEVKTWEVPSTIRNETHTLYEVTKHNGKHYRYVVVCFDSNGTPQISSVVNLRRKTPMRLVYGLNME